MLSLCKGTIIILQIAYPFLPEKFKMNFYLPGPGMSGDNAAMIGLAAYYHIIEGEKGDWRKSEISANLQITDL